MPLLIKDKDYEFVPGIPGTEAIPGVPASQGTPGHYSTETKTVTSCRTTICALDPSPSGYNSPQPCSRSVVCRTRTVEESVWHPPIPGTPGSPGVPGTPGTPAQVIEYLREGWNSHSRSANKLKTGEYFSYKVKEGSGGVIISVGVPGKSNHRINTFPQSLLVENSGVIVFQNGVKIKTIKYTYSSSSLLRVYRQPDNKIACVITTGTETIVHVFTNGDHGSAMIPLHVYAHLYLGDDIVKDSALKIGKITFGKA